MDLFISAIKKANIKTINEFLKAGYVNTEFKNRDGTLKEGTETPLFTAITTGNLNIVDLLLNNKADKEARNVKEETPLFAAIRLKQNEIVKLLLDKGADSEAKNPNDETPIFAAIEPPNYPAFDLLLEKGVNLEAKNKDSFTPLLLSIHMRHFIFFKKLIEHGADLEAKDNKGQTPLFYSIFRHLYLSSKYENPNDYFDLLVLKGANVNAKADNNYTPLTYAAVYDYNDLIKKLLILGARIEDVKEVINKKTENLLPEQIQAYKNMIDKLKQIKDQIKQKNQMNLYFNLFEKIKPKQKGPNPFNMFNKKNQGAINGSTQGGKRKRKTNKKSRKH